MRHHVLIGSIRPLTAAPVALYLAVAVSLSATPLDAQRPAPLAPRAEFRVGALITPVMGIHAGLGAEVRAGWYSRVGVGFNAGAIHRSNGWVGSQGMTLTARFLFDPYAERPIGLYGGAGLGFRVVDGATIPGELLILAGVEGAAKGRVIPALEVVLGGGVRVQGVFRVRRDVGR